MASLRIFGREIGIRMLLPIMVFIVFSMLLWWAFGSGITGLAIFNVQHNHTDTISMEFNESGEYEWNLANVGDVRSIKIDGSKNNSGTAKVYIEKDGVRYLIFDSTQLVEQESGIFGITGFAVKEDKDKDKDKDKGKDDEDKSKDDDKGKEEKEKDKGNETEDGSDEDNNQNETQDDIEDNNANDGNETQEQDGEDGGQEQSNDQNNQTESDEDGQNSNDNQNNESNNDSGNDESDENDQDEGNNDGNETDSDGGGNETDEDAGQDEDEQNETEDEAEENNAPIWNSGVDSFSIGSEITINLNDYYYDADNDSLAFSSSNVENVTITIESGIATIIPEEGIDDTKQATFAAYDGTNITYKSVSLVINTLGDSNETVNETEEEIIESLEDIEVGLEYGDYEGYDSNNDGIEDLTGVIDFSVSSTRFNFDENKDNLCTRYEVYSENNEESTLLCHGSADCCSVVELANSRDEWNETLFLTYGSYSASEDNLVFAQVIHADYNLTGENPYFNVTYSEWANLTAKFQSGIIEFENVCEDTCLLSGFNTSQYKLIIEINNTRLVIDEIKYVIEEKITNDVPILLQEIANASLVEDTNYTIELSEYFYDADNDTLVYSYFNVDNVTIRFEDNFAYIMPQEGFTGNRFTYIMANDSYSSVSSNIFKIEVNASGRPKIELGKPVKWRETIFVNATNETVKLTIPETASNITLTASVNDVVTAIDNSEIKIIDNGENKTKDTFEKEKELEKVKRKTSLLEEARKDNAVKVVMENEELRNEDIDDKILELEGEQSDIEDQLNNQGPSGITGAVVGFAEVQEISSNDTVVEINQTVESITIEYVTQAPYAIEKQVDNNVKQIRIISEANYTDVLAFTDISETKRDSIRLFWLKETGREEFGEIDYLDTNLDGFVDRLEWVVPHLSNQTFEVSITVLNVQSYPTVGGNWTVRFNTTGIGNLTIMASNGTTYSELFNDNSSTIDDLVPLSLMCNDYEHYNKNDLINSFNFQIILNNNSMVSLADTIGESFNIKGVYLEDYSCNTTAFWTVQVLTEGVHVQQFNFSNQIAYGNNFASVANVTTNGSIYRFVDDTDEDFNRGNTSLNVSVDGTGVGANITLVAVERTWSQIGNNLTITSAVWPALAALNATRIAFIDSGNDNLSVYEFDGTAWSQIGNNLTITGAGPPALAALNATRIAFIDFSNDKLGTYEFDGTAWSQIGNNLTITGAGFPALAALNASRVAFIDSNNVRLTTYEFDGTAWSQIGNSLTITGTTNAALAALNASRVAFIDDTHQNLTAYEFDGTNWAQVGNRLAIAGSGPPALSALTTSRVAFIDGGIDKLGTYEFDGTAWSQIGNNLTILTNDPALAALTASRVAFIEDANSKLGTYEFNTIYALAGNFTSQAFDANRTVNWSYISWENVTPVRTNLTLYTRTSADNATWTAWTQHGTSPSLISSRNRYLQYLAAFNTSNASLTPKLLNATINYSLLINLSIWDETDTITRVITQNTRFYANFTDFANTINGSNVWCTWSNNASGWSVARNMTFNSTNGLYFYNTTFASYTSSGASFNVTCDGTALGYNIVKVLDTFVIYPSLNISVNLNDTLVLVNTQDPIAVSGHINLSNGTNVSNNGVNLFLDGTAMGFNNVTINNNVSEKQFADGSNTEFNSGALSNVSIYGSGANANITLNKNESSQYPNTTGFFISQSFDAGMTVNWTAISWSENNTILENYFGNGSDGNAVITSDTNLTVTQNIGLYDGDMVVKNYNSLTINPGTILTLNQSARGMIIYVKGNAFINGTLSMSARGARANPASDADSSGRTLGPMGLRFAVYMVNGTGSLNASEFNGTGGAALSATSYHPPIDGFGRVFIINRTGSAGGAAQTTNAAGNPGKIGGNGSTGGGAGGGGNGNNGGGAAGAAGTAFSGGSAGGGASGAVAGTAGEGTAGGAFGGVGGTGGTPSELNHGAGGGGAGNPGGPRGGGAGAASNGENGTGGLLILIVGGNLTIGPQGMITANGTRGGDGGVGTDNGRGGGGSGGGSVFVLYEGSLTNDGGILEAEGGIGGNSGNGGKGGNGSVTGPLQIGISTSIKIMTRTSNDNVTWSEWSPTYVNSTASYIVQNNTARYLQYMANLSTLDSRFTPILNNVTLNYTGFFTDNYGNYNFTFNAPANAGTYTLKVNSTWDSTIPGEQTSTFSVIQTPTNILLNVTPNVQGFGQNVTLTANVTDTSGQVNNVHVEIKPYGEQAANYTMVLQTDTLWKYNFTDFTNGTYVARAYSNSSGIFENSTNKTFDMFVNLTILVRTLRDTYSVNQFVNLTDPPGMIEAENSNQLSDNIKDNSLETRLNVLEKIRKLWANNSLLAILLLSILLNISAVGISISQKGSVNIPLLIIINLLLLIPAIYAFSGASGGYDVVIGNTPYISAHEANASGYNLSFQLNAEAYGRGNASNINGSLGQIYITSGPIIQPLTTQFGGGTTDFGNQPNLQSVCNAVFENVSAGKIEYRNCINAEGMDLDNNLFIRKNYVEVKTRNLHSSFNRSANITFIGLTHLGYPKILKDGIDCEDCAILSWSSDTGIAVFNVSSFSNYTAAEANQSKVQNNGTTNASVYLLVKVQFYNTSNNKWVDTTTMVNDTSPRTLYSNGTLLKIDSLFNGRWNSSANSTFGAGTYRVFTAATDENDVILRNFDGRNITVSYNFTVDFGKPGINFTNPTPSNNSRAKGNVHVINASALLQGSSILSSCTLEVNNGTMEVNNGTIPAQNFTMEIQGTACNVTIRTFDGFNYTLRAYVNDTTGSENVTQNHTFRENTQPTIPTQIKPLNGSIVTADLTLLNYTTIDNDTDVVNYIIYFDTNSNPVAQVYRGPSSTFVVNTVAAAIYYWKVQADDSYENSSNSTVFQFTKNTAPPIPLVIAPNVTGIELRGGQIYNLSWDNSTSDVNGNNISISISYSTDSGLTFPNQIASGLIHSGSYLWTVPSINTDKARIKVTANDSTEFTSDTGDNDFMIDSTAPTITLDEPVNGSSFNNGTFINLTLTDLLAGLSNVSWNNNSYPGSLNRTDFNGTYDINTTDWHLGEVNITVFANDSVGNFISAYYTFTVTSIRPVVSYNAPSANQEIRGTFKINVSATEFIDDAPFVNFTYESAPQNFTMTQAGTDYFYNLDTTGISDRLLKMSVYGNDTLGRVVVADRYAIVDNTAPVIRLDQPDNNSFKNASPSFAFTPTEANTLASCSLIVNNTVNRTSTTLFSGITNNFSNIAFGSGVHSWTVNCTDGAGNVGTNTTLRLINIDLIRPTITLVDPPNESVVRINRTINFTVTDSGGAGVDNVMWSNSYVVDVQTLIDSYAINTSEFPEGLTNISIRVNDTAGNVQKLLLSYTFDATPPIAEFNKPGVLQIIRGNFTVNVTATDVLSNVSGLLFAYNGSANFTMTRASSSITSDYTFDWNTTNATDNQHILKIFGNDSANNIKFESRFGITDNTAPAIQLDAPANATRSTTSLNTFTFTPYEFHAVSSCTLYINGTVNVTSASMTANASNTLSTTLSDGTYKWDIGCNDTAVDNFGIHNTGYNLSNYTISVDTVLPVFNASVNTTVPGHLHIVNISANGSDVNGLSIGQITVNDSGIKKIYNFSLNGVEEAGFSQNVTIFCFGGCVINFSTRVNDSSGNYRTNDTILTAIDDLRPVANTSLNKSLSNILFGDTLNFTANVTDEVGLDTGQIVENISGIKRFYNFTLSGNAAQISRSFAINIVRGNVINFSAVVNDSAGNYRTNDTIITVADYVANVSIGVNNTSPKVNEVVNVSSNTTDTDNLAFCLIKTNQSGVFVNNTFALSGSTGFCSDPVTITATRGHVVNFTVEINDTVGGVIYQNSTKITVANTPPGAPSILLPANDLHTNAQSLELNVTFARDADSDAMTINYYINGKINSSTGVNTTFNASDGYYILNVSITDGFDHSANVSVNFTIDTVVPVANTSLNRSLTGILINDMINLTANITDDVELSTGQLIANISGIKRFYNFTLSGRTAQIGQNFSITSGKGSVINFSAVVNDSAGNYRTNDTIITVANRAPTIAISFPTSNHYTKQQPLDLNITSVDDDNDAITIRYYINGILNQSSSSNTTMNVSDGYYILNVSATDGTDSSANSSVNFTIDTIIPGAFNLTSPANGTSSTDLTPDFAWNRTAETNFANYTVEVSDDSSFSTVDHTIYSTAINETNATKSIATDTTWYWRVIAFDRVQNNFTTGSFTYTTQTASTPSVDSGTSGGSGGGGGGESSGGGGGGGLILSTEKDYSVSPGSIKAKVALGESAEKTLTISNTGDLGLTISIDVIGVDDFLFLQDNMVSVDAGESVEIMLNFIGKEVGSFTGKIMTEADDIKVEIPVILEVISEKVLFDAKIDIPSEYTVVQPGGELKSQVTLLNVGAPEKVDVFVTYFIKDLNGDTIYEETETFAVETQSSFTKSFKIPESLENGKYVAIMEVRYADSFAVSSQLFEVQENRNIVQQLVAHNTFMTVSMLFVLVGFAIIMLLTMLPKRPKFEGIKRKN